MWFEELYAIPDDLKSCVKKIDDQGTATTLLFKTPGWID